MESNLKTTKWLNTKDRWIVLYIILSSILQQNILPYSCIESKLLMLVGNIRMDQTKIPMNKIGNVVRV